MSSRQSASPDAVLFSERYSRDKGWERTVLFLVAQQKVLFSVFLFRDDMLHSLSAVVLCRLQLRSILLVCNWLVLSADARVSRHSLIPQPFPSMKQQFFFSLIFHTSTDSKEQKSVLWLKSVISRRALLGSLFLVSQRRTYLLPHCELWKSQCYFWIPGNPRNVKRDGSYMNWEFKWPGCSHWWLFLSARIEFFLFRLCIRCTFDHLALIVLVYTLSISGMLSRERIDQIDDPHFGLISDRFASLLQWQVLNEFSCSAASI